MADNWETPHELFSALDSQFHFTLDPCADPSNAKCSYYFTKNEDGLSYTWKYDRVFMNPPYGRKIKKWVKKAYSESLKGAFVVGLLPASTDTNWFHDYILGKATVKFLRGRIHFSNADRAPFPSMIVIWQPPSS